MTRRTKFLATRKPSLHGLQPTCSLVVTYQWHVTHWATRLRTEAKQALHSGQCLDIRPGPRRPRRGLAAAGLPG